MRSGIALILLVLLAAAGGCRKDPSQQPALPPNSSPFPQLPPVAGANPNVRRKQAFQVPTRLVVERMANRISVSVDMNSLESVQIEAGRKMVFGFKDQIFVTVDGQRKLMREGMGSSAYIGTPTFSTEQHGIPVEGQSYDIEVEFLLFETDIPPQHMWSPEGGKYREIWSRTLKARC